MPELNSRIKSLLRRRKFDGYQEIIIEKMGILPENRQVFVQDKLLSITKKEFDLLIFFISNQGRVLTKESIAEHLWGDFANSSDSFDLVYLHIKNLRFLLVILWLFAMAGVLFYFVLEKVIDQNISMMLNS